MVGLLSVLWPLSEPALALLLLGQLEVGVGQDTHERAGDAQALIERERVLEENIAPKQSDAELKVPKHVIAESVQSRRIKCPFPQVIAINA